MSEYVHAWACAERSIPDGVARTIAAWWQAPSNPGLTMLASTGTITVERAVGEILAALPDATPAQQLPLRALAAYVLRHGDRGPKRGWSRVWADRLPSPAPASSAVEVIEWFHPSKGRKATAFVNGEPAELELTVVDPEDADTIDEWRRQAQDARHGATPAAAATIQEVFDSYLDAGYFSSADQVP
ncbi:hypothetical protein [Amycolatopsis anabasis]|uniref:hypothetical protein n=1 Tax=Amycolatopsis anabasis TaxID=1840409 RepID=UPI00131E9E08|nr:hypothetical protein [Amycolatopsis anabasis]